MSKLTLVPHTSKSKQIIHNCLRRVFKVATNREIEMIGIFMIDKYGKVHLDKIGPISWQQTDQMLTALEQLHENIYLALRDY